MKEFGNADEFYRARIVSLDSLGVGSLDWREDILYKEQTIKQENIQTSFKLQILDIKMNEPVHEITFKSAKDAEKVLKDILEDLSLMTNNEFYKKHISEQNLSC